MFRLYMLGAAMIITPLMQGCSKTDLFPERAAQETVVQELAKLAPVALETELTGLTESDRLVVAKLIQAAKEIDELFLLQVDPQNPTIRRRLEQEGLTDHLELFKVMFGKWNRLVHHEPFLDQQTKPAGAGFYPVDMTREEFEQTLISHPEKQSSLTSEFTLIQRVNGQLKAVPFHEIYPVQRIAELLSEAAKITRDASLARFLELRSKAFLTDDYFESDMAWMDLSGDLEVVIGPYEVYEDALFNSKASYEAFICRVDHEESQKLAQAASWLTEMEKALPIPDEYKNFNRGSSSPIKIVNELYAAGDTKAGVQTTAFNLPNDERVREAKGSKKVMLKNIARAKFEKCWIPIVEIILSPDILPLVSFDAYFNHVLMHEISHGLGPGTITLKNGEKTTVSRELKEQYSTIEECKADVLGIVTFKFLIDKGVFPRELEASMYASYLGGMFRSIRFGITEAHGGGVAIQFNHLINSGAFFVDQNGKLNYDQELFWPALTELATKLLILQAEGDYDGAKSFIESNRQMTPLMAQYIKQLSHLPVDIRPSYPIEDQLKNLTSQK